MGIRIITNNSKVNDKYADKYEVEYLETNYLGVLLKVRDLVHLGFEMYTHPLSGSIKPNETPYKSIIISNQSKSLDYDSLKIIETSIETTKKFLRDLRTPNWTERVKEDFKEIDCSIIDNALNIRQW